jgi:hypothetical protein
MITTMNRRGPTKVEGLMASGQERLAHGRWVAARRRIVPGEV